MKDKILKQLKENQGKYLSGEELSSCFDVSRTAIWKAINQLKSMGYTIESQTKLGYRYIEGPDSITSLELQPLLDTKKIGRQVKYLESVDSTNSFAKRLSENGFEDGSVVIADVQTAGRGRLGRSWISPKSRGIWMTIMLKPQINPMDASKVTLLAAYALCKSIKAETGLEASIKWPNDIIAGRKKLCGILTEMGAELDIINYLIVGVGINANLIEDDFPEELIETATSIRLETGMEVTRKRLAASFLNEFEKCYEAFSSSGSIEHIIDAYKDMLHMLGKKVRAIYKNEELIGEAIDVSSEGQLLIRLEDGSIREIVSGEVSVRGIYGYV